MTQTAADAATAGADFQLTRQQVAFFEQFGFLRIPGLFEHEIGDITKSFEKVFADESNDRMETYDDLHGGEKRLIIPVFIDRDPTLTRLRTDSRVEGIVRSLIGEPYVYAESDGNLFFCESSWHLDIYGAQLTQQHIKLSFYLDRLDADSGAIRMIPGSHHEGTFARNLRRRFFDHISAMELYGVEEREIPSWTIANEPGDVVVWNYRTIHASYNGAARRRLFSISFREPEPVA
jgi:hypothetical protein